MAYAMRNRNTQVQAASGLDVVAGIWLLISPFLLGFSATQAATNNIILGVLIAIIAAVRAFGAYEYAGLSWLNALLGLWVLFSPWILGFARLGVPTTNNVIVGIIVIALATWSALASSPTRNQNDQNDYSGMV